MKVLRIMLAGSVAALTVLTTAGPAAAGRTGTSRVSVSNTGGQAGTASDLPAISADGRYVAFTSAAKLANGDTNAASDVYLRDRRAGTTVLVSVSSTGAAGDDGSLVPSISADGRYVSFYSVASTLVPGDTNGGFDVFVRDLRGRTTTRVSVSSSGTQANDWSFDHAISANGRYVTYYSYASNLVPGDSNGVSDVFVHDRRTGTTTRVSVSDAGAQGNAESRYPSISANGRYVGFGSPASNLVPDDTNGAFDVFVHDLRTGTTTRVSVSDAGVQGNAESFETAVSATGRYVAFTSSASTLVPGDTNFTYDVFLRDRHTATTVLVSVSSTGVQGEVYSSDPAISATGRYVTFTSVASTLVPGDTNGFSDVFVRDLRGQTTTRVSVSSTGTQAGNASFDPAISADGRYVAFTSDASDLVPGDTNGFSDVFVRRTRR